MQHIRVLPYELIQEHAQRKEDATNACEVHWAEGTHRSLLRRRSVSLVRGGVLFPTSSPSAACGGAVAQRFLRARAACGEEIASERGKE